MNAEEMEEIKRHFDVAAEGLRHDWQHVAKGHETILAQIQHFREDMKKEFKEVRP